MSQVRRNIPSFTAVTSSFRSYIFSLPLLTTTIVCVTILLYALDALLLSVNTVYSKIDLLPEKFFEGQGSLIFNYKDVSVGGLSPWVFGVVVWESRELAGRERDFFSNIELRAPFSRIVNIRGFIKAEEGNRSGWWLPLSNEESMDDHLEASSIGEGAAEVAESGNTVTSTAYVSSSSS
ncbi:3887_t:CDS:2 [Acaulospora colombiana]|uniref:3887_t:CDS:1 n=1 Tax=Acaulospora colombiana TaxID=27376 RepID=A0ACA9LLR2_9GLOM|nr:3887_t:CDS:2 [Acaulospora colombiana]